MNKKQMKEKPIRIAHIIGKMWAGGVEAVVFNYYRAIDHNRFQFDFYYDEDSTVDPPNDLIDMGARFIKLPPYQKLPQYLRELRNHFKYEKYNIVHSHLNTLSIFPLYAAWREHIPIRIAHNHSVPGGNEIKRNIAKQIFRRFSKLFATDYFACSEKSGRWMFGNKDFDTGNVFVMKNAIEFERFKVLRDEIDSCKKKYGINNKFVVGHIGRFTYAKNHQFLLDIFKEILSINENAVLMLVGDGELHDEIIKGIEKRRLSNHVLMIGKVYNPEKYYCLNDVIIIPSIFEGLSMSTVESQIAGVPVVISKAIPEEAVISDGCKHMDINDPPAEWAKVAVSIAKCKLKVKKNSLDYNIFCAVKKLEEKYAKLLFGRE